MLARPSIFIAAVLLTMVVSAPACRDLDALADCDTVCGDVSAPVHLGLELE